MNIYIYIYIYICCPPGGEEAPGAGDAGRRRRVHEGREQI